MTVQKWYPAREPFSGNLIIELQDWYTLKLWFCYTPFDWYFIRAARFALRAEKYQRSPKGERIFLKKEGEVY